MLRNAGKEESHIGRAPAEAVRHKTGYPTKRKDESIMEVKEKSKKRELIKTIAIVFLAVLLVLTFFSQTIMNRSLPEVATQMASSGTINAKIRGSGTVSANESYEVNINQTREVRSVCVKVGDKVETGDLLFVLGDIESQELQTAQEALDNARLSYQKRVLELSKTYATEDQNVKVIREDLEEAYAQRDANYVTDEQVSYAKGDLASAKSVLSQIELALKELNAQQSDSEEYTEAKAKVTELESKIRELETSIKSYETEIEGYRQQLNEAGGSSDAQAAVADAQKAVNDAKSKWANDYAANSSVYQAMLSNVEQYYREDRGEYIPALSSSATITVDAFMQQDSYVRTYLANVAAAGSDGDEDQTRTAASTAEESRVYGILYADQQAIETANKALEEAQRAASSANNTAWNQQKAIQDKISAAQSSRSAAESELRTAQADLSSASNANAQLKDQIRQQEAFQRQQEAQITTLESALAELQEKQTAYKAALDTVSAKERELENALSGKDIDKQLNNLDLQTMSLEIQKYEEQVEKYRKESVDAEITSPVSGVVTAISVSAGKETTPDAAMATIDVVDRGYTIKIPVTNEQAKNVKVGDTAEITNYYWGGNDITATLEQIASDPSSAGQKKLLVFRITGEIEAGTNISLSIGQRSTVMDTIIPKSALREDSNGKFVFVITSKSTPLGNRYTATRVDVQVIGEDDTSAAVSGLSQNDYVITTSSKPLDAGSQVRMVENPS